MALLEALGCTIGLVGYSRLLITRHCLKLPLAVCLWVPKIVRISELPPNPCLLLQKEFVALENRLGLRLILFVDWNSTAIDGWMNISDIKIRIDNLVGFTTSQGMVLRCGMIFFSLSTDFAD